MKRFILSLVLIAVSVPALAQLPEVVLGPGLNSGRTPYYQSWNRTLSADTAYVLTGSTMSIPPTP